MALRVCSQTGCPELVVKGRCPACAAQHEQQRGSRQQRGYDAAYDRGRKREERKVALGQAACWSCLERISPLTPWDYGHCDLDRTVIHGAQHVACNRDTSQPGCAHISHKA